MLSHSIVIPIHAFIFMATAFASDDIIVKGEAPPWHLKSTTSEISKACSTETTEN